MTPAEFLQLIEDGRRFSLAFEGATFDLALSTALDVRLASSRSIDGDGRINVARSQHELVAGAITGWRDVPAAWVLADVEGLLPFDRSLIRPLLANRLDLEDALADEIYKRRAAREAARKNSPSASPSN